MGRIASQFGHRLQAKAYHQSSTATPLFMPPNPSQDDEKKNDAPNTRPCQSLTEKTTSPLGELMDLARPYQSDSDDYDERNNLILFINI